MSRLLSHSSPDNQELVHNFVIEPKNILKFGNNTTYHTDRRQSLTFLCCFGYLLVNMLLFLWSGLF